MHFDQFGISFETCTMILMQLLYAARSMGLLDLIRKYIKSRVVYIPALWAVLRNVLQIQQHNLSEMIK